MTTFDVHSLNTVVLTLGGLVTNVHIRSEKRKNTRLILSFYVILWYRVIHPGSTTTFDVHNFNSVVRTFWGLVTIVHNHLTWTKTFVGISHFVLSCDTGSYTPVLRLLLMFIASTLWFWRFEDLWQIGNLWQGFITSTKHSLDSLIWCCPVTQDHPLRFNDYFWCSQPQHSGFDSRRTCDIIMFITSTKNIRWILTFYVVLWHRTIHSGSTTTFDVHSFNSVVRTLWRLVTVVHNHLSSTKTFVRFSHFTLSCDIGSFTPVQRLLLMLTASTLWF